MSFRMLCVAATTVWERWRPAAHGFAALAIATVLLAGCGESASMVVAPAPTLPPPMPAGMQEMPPQPPLPADETGDDCNATASLRPFDNPADADAAVANIRARGRLIVGLDIGSNLFSFRDPITGEIVGFDVDVAGEVARDIFGNPAQVEYRILSSAERITALQKRRSRRRSQDDDHQLRPAQAGQLLDCLSRCRATYSGSARLPDHQAGRSIR